MSRKRRKRETALARVEESKDEVVSYDHDVLDDFVDRLSERMDQRASARWSGLAVGLGVVAVIGLAGVVIYLLVRKKDGKVLGQLGEMAGFPPITIVNQIPGLPGEVRKEKIERVDRDAPYFNLPERVAQADVVNHDTSMRTVRLTPTAALRVATAPSNNPWRVNIRVLGPPGSWAAFATDYTRLHPGDPSADDVMVVPSGGTTVVQLNPRQILYGMSNVDGVVTSVVVNEHILGATPVLSVVR